MHADSYVVRLTTIASVRITIVARGFPCLWIDDERQRADPNVSYCVNCSANGQGRRERGVNGFF